MKWESGSKCTHVDTALIFSTCGEEVRQMLGLCYRGDNYFDVFGPVADLQLGDFHSLSIDQLA